jgi:hypothetical protein
METIPSIRRDARFIQGKMACTGIGNIAYILFPTAAKASSLASPAISKVDAPARITGTY